MHTEKRDSRVKAENLSRDGQGEQQHQKIFSDGAPNLRNFVHVSFVKE
jgi:hypothetical protein